MHSFFDRFELIIISNELKSVFNLVESVKIHQHQLGKKSTHISLFKGLLGLLSLIIDHLKKLMKINFKRAISIGNLNLLSIG